ncbi:MAG: xanthine dehydrogenase accessory protein XdhC [Myxococcota bacterium]
MVAFERVAALERSGGRGVLVTVVDARGSTPRKAGARMLVLEDGTAEGTVGGGAVEHQAMQSAKEVLKAGEPRFVEVHLGQELGMCCGGTMRLYLEPLGVAVPFILLGGGHVAKACAAILPSVGFAVHVADGRDGFATEARFPLAATRLDGLDHEDLEKLPFGPNAFVLVTTHDHQLDQKLVEMCLRRPARWLGMIGSRRKALKTRERCLHKGFTSEELARLRSPVGLDLGAETPEEIAISIVSEVLHLRRRGEAPAAGVPSMSMKLGEAQPTDVTDEPMPPPADLQSRRQAR